MRYLPLLAISLSTMSCSDFLTLKPEYLMYELGFYQNESDFETAVVGLYSGLQSYGQNLIWMNELATDNAVFQLANAETAVTGFDYMNLSATNAYVSTYWSNSYGMISRANGILNRLSNFDFNSKAKMQGECKFIRALAYFQLVQLFGDVSITELEFSSPNQIADYDFSRKPVDQVYQLIIQDLMDAESLLSSEIPENKGKVSIGAVKALLGKVYLTRHEYDKSAEKLKEVIDLNAYSLEQDYGSLFSEGNDDKSESILEIEFASGNLGEGSNFAHHFYPNVINMDVFSGGILGGGRCVPSETLWNTYEEGDLRRDAALGNKLPMKDGTTSDYYFCKKFVDYSATTTSDCGVNFTLLRYADVLLMYAEALNELGKASEALLYINQVRQRAGIGDLHGLSQTALRTALEKERQCELCFEGHRWFDLMRTGRTLEVLNEDFKNRGLAFSVEEYELLLPIPQGQIDIDPDLEQNPGY